MNYELYQQGPETYVTVLILNLIVTILAYGAFPFIFAKTRNTPITKKKYKRLCYWINAAVMLGFLILNGGIGNGAPYLLWTWVFSRYGIKELGKRGIMQESDYYEKPDYRFRCSSCGYEDTIKLDTCPKCGAYNYKQTKQTTEPKESKPIVVANSSEPNIDDMTPQEAAEYLVTLQINESHPAQSSATPKDKVCFCRKCGSKLLSDSIYCSKCGTKVVEAPVVTVPEIDDFEFCKKCGADITNDTKTCHVCGTKVVEVPIVTVSKIDDFEFCKKCGADITNDTKTCHVCGEQICNKVT